MFSTDTLLENMGSVVNGNVQPPVWEDEQYQAYCSVHNPIRMLERIRGIPALVYQGMKDEVVSPLATQVFEQQLTETGEHRATFVYDENGSHTASVMFLNHILPYLKQFVP